MSETNGLGRWQARMRPWIQGLVTGAIIVFLCLTAWQIYYIHGRILDAPTLDLSVVRSGDASMASEQWRTLAALELHAMSRRYHQANVILMARIWTTYLGFLTGVILAILGAGFILGKIREKPTEITGKTELWNFTIASTSPGLVMVTLGTVLMVSAILTHHEIGVTDRPLYLGTLDSIVVTQQNKGQGDSGLKDAIEAIKKRRAEGFSADSTRTQ